MIIISGYRGWIGSALCQHLQTLKRPHVGVDRAFIQEQGLSLPGARHPSVAIHLAAIAHVTTRRTAEQAYLAANHQHTLMFAQQAKTLGVKRFVFVSTAKVLGEFTEQPANEQVPAAPPEAYSRAKLAAEQDLLAMHQPGQFEITILRPPLVYGPGVRANFLQLLKLASLPIPLLASNNTRRSMIYLDNLVDALVHAADGKLPTGQVWFVKDEQDWQFHCFLRSMRRALGGSAPILAVPLRPGRQARAALLGWPGLGEKVVRLTASLQVDDSALRATGWAPPVSNQAALERTVHWFKSTCR